MSVIVCDSGPLTHLWQIRQWAAFAVFAEIHLADQVVEETRNHVPLDAFATITTSRLLIHTVDRLESMRAKDSLGSNIRLQDADLATFVLAQRLAPSTVLTDDLALRRVVESAGLVAIGSVGLLLRAFTANLLSADELKQAIDTLFVHSSLYLSPIFREFVQREVEKALQSR